MRPDGSWVKVADYDALDARLDEAMQALAMLCEHHYTYVGADADTANDHGLYAKVKTARATLNSLRAPALDASSDKEDASHG
jgi:hypothetical protein